MKPNVVTELSEIKHNKLALSEDRGGKQDSSGYG